MTMIRCGGGLAVNMVRTGPRGRPPLSFMHAVGLDLTWWDLQIAAFRDEHDVIAFDMPGHGLSGALDGPPSLERLAAVAARCINASRRRAAHVVGLSVGGMIVQALALVRPHLIQSLTSVATLCTFPDAVRPALPERTRVARADGMAATAPLSLEARYICVDGNVVFGEFGLPTISYQRSIGTWPVMIGDPAL